MQTLTIALLQIAPTGSQSLNLEKGLRFCREAAVAGADLALFPEMWNTGYSFTDPDPRKAEELAAFRGQALELGDGFVQTHHALAAELGLTIGLTFLERAGEQLFNTLLVIDSLGRDALHYRKVHTCDFDAEACLTPGAGFTTCTLETAGGTVQLGGMICMDREFPESARVLMLQGAELILVPNACGLEQHRLAQFRTRAFENMTALAMANYPPPTANGHSSLVSPICFDGQEGSVENVLLEAGDEEGIYIVELDLDVLREYRSREAWGNAYRKPFAYGPLLDEEAQPPFVRRDARR